MDINKCIRSKRHCSDDDKHHLLKTFNALNEIAQLAPKDFAFVKRTSGEWQPAVVVAVSPTHAYEKKWIKFLLDIDGHTKTIPACKWTKLICLVHFPATPVDPDGALPTLRQIGTKSAPKGKLPFKQTEDSSTRKDHKFQTNDNHQRAFMSALASIDSPRSTKSRVV
jgi:hypothetical protein